MIISCWPLGPSQELIRLHTVMRAPLTTVNPNGWNAEMLAARQLNVAHTGYLQRTVAQQWRDQYREVFSLPFLPEEASDAFADMLVRNSGHLFRSVLCVALMLVLLLLWSCCSKPLITLQFTDITFRILWLLLINAAFLTWPPMILIAWNKQVWVSAVPHVDKWNPLPVTIEFVLLSGILSVVWCMCLDARTICEKVCAFKEREPATPQDRDQDARTICAFLFETEPKDIKEAATPQDRYQDPNSPLLGCICIFLLMTFLMIIYLQTVMNPLAMDPKRNLLWLGALLVQVRFTLDDRTVQKELQYDAETLHRHLRNFRRCKTYQGAGSGHPKKGRNIILRWMRWAACMVTPENSKIWMLHLVAWEGNKTLLCSHEPGDTSHKTTHEEKHRRRDPWNPLQIWSRFVMSYLSNGLYKAILVYTLPLWLCRGGLADFVLNAFALVYIVELDDTKAKQLIGLQASPIRTAHESL